VSIPSSTPAIRSSTSPIPSRCRGFCGSPDRDAVGGGARDRLSGFAAEVLVDAALDDPVHGLLVRAVLFVPFKAAGEPAVGALGRAGRVVAGDVERRALVERQRDIGVQGRLNRHRSLWAHELLAPVKVRTKANAVLVDAEDRARAVHRPLAAPALDLVRDGAMAHREHLEAARVGDDRPLPAHELV